MLAQAPFPWRAVGGAQLGAPGDAAAFTADHPNAMVSRPQATHGVGGATRNIVSRAERSVAAASRRGGVRGELHGVWKTFADVAGKTVEVIGKKVDVMFTFVEMSCAPEDGRCAHVFVMFKDVVATFTQQDVM